VFIHGCEKGEHSGNDQDAHPSGNVFRPVPVGRRCHKVNDAADKEENGYPNDYAPAQLWVHQELVDQPDTAQSAA
jgi:hypothetical protein